jgi:tetratricopeptide (TPR) repeat protein
MTRPRHTSRGPRASGRGPLLFALAVSLAPASAWPQAAEPDSPADSASRAGTPEELEAYNLARQDRYVKARELAEQILRRAPQSFAATYVLGVAHYFGEGNLPRALWYLREARTLFERQYGADPPTNAPWRWHSDILVDLADLCGDMDLLHEKLEALDAHDRIYRPPLLAEHAWPLMKLGRYDEARRVVAAAVASGRPRQRKVALTALCAIESEAGKRAESYQACRQAAEELRGQRTEGAAEYSNAGEAALGMLRLDEAERDFLEATRRPPTLYGNPYAKLVELYLREGRVAEAVKTMKDAHRHRRSKPAYLDQLSQAEIDGLSSLLLLAVGRAAEALPLTQRALDRPDRRGGISSQREQATAAAAILDRMARREVAERLAEERATLGFWAGLRRTWAAARLRVEAWSSGRRAALLLADRRRLLATLRPSFSGGADIPVWLNGELVSILGAGVMEQAVREARAEESLPEAGPYLDAVEAEAALAAGKPGQALAAADRALAGLPPAETLLAGRVAAAAAAAARAAGDPARELRYLDLALQKDPTAVRRLGLSLPVTITTDGSEIARRAAAHLRSSPRFRAGTGGLTLAVSATSACLHAAGGTVIQCASVQPRAGEDAKGLAQRLADEIHARAFAPRIDLSQTDVRSLDGSTGVGDARSSDRARSVLDDLRGPRPKERSLDIELNEN